MFRPIANNLQISNPPSFPNYGFLDQAIGYANIPSIDGKLIGEGNSNTRDMQPGRSPQFDGADSYLVGDAVGFSGEASVSLWLYISAWPASSYWVFDNSVSTSTGFQIAYTNNGRVFVSVNGAGWTLTSELNTISLNNWYLVTLTAGPTGANLYVNGRDVVNVVTDQTVIESTESCYVGVRGDLTYYVNGKLFDCRVYNSKLTESEVQQLYELGSDALPNKPTLRHWKLDENIAGLYLDSSGNDKHLTKTSWDESANQHTGTDVPFSWPNEKGYSNYLKLDGVDDSVILGDVLSIERTDTFEIEFYAKWTGASKVLVSKMAPGSPYRGWEIGTFSTAIQVYFNNTLTTNSIAARFGGGYNDGNLRHFKLTYDGSSTVAGMKFYVDGVEVAAGTTTDTLSATTVSSDFLFIGARSPGTTLNTDVTMFDLKVTINGVLQLDLPMDEGSGGKVVDASGNGYDGRIVGATWTHVNRLESDKTKDSYGQTLQYTGKNPGYALCEGNACGTFDGVDDYVNLGTDSQLEIERTDTVELEYWHKGTDSAGAVVGKRLSSGTYRGWLCYLASGKHTFIICNTAWTNALYVEAPTATNDGVWRHYKWTYDGSSSAAGIRLWIDGVEQTIATYYDSLSATTVSAGITTIGSDNGGTSNFLAASLCGIKLTKNGTLIGDWRLSEGAGGPGFLVHDYSGNDNHGTLTGVTESTFWGTGQSVYAANAAYGFSEHLTLVGTAGYLAASTWLPVLDEYLWDGDFRFDYQYSVQNFGCIIGVQTETTKAASLAYTIVDFGVQWLNSTSLRVYRNGSITDYTGLATITSSSVISFRRVGSTLGLYLDDVLVVSDTNSDTLTPVATMSNATAATVKVIYVNGERIVKDSTASSCTQTLQKISGKDGLDLHGKSVTSSAGGHNRFEGTLDFTGNVSSPAIYPGDPQNLLTSADISSGTWVQTTATNTEEGTAPDGNGGHCVTALLNNGWTGHYWVGVGFTGGKKYNWSVWLKRKTGTGLVKINADPYNSTWTTVAVTDEWQRFDYQYNPVSTVSPSYSCGILMGTSGDAVYAALPMLIENDGARWYMPPSFDATPPVAFDIKLHDIRLTKPLTDAYWTKIRATVAYDAATGISTITEDGTAANSHAVQSDAGIGTTGKTTSEKYAIVLEAKANGRDFICVGDNNPAQYAYFDLANGVVGNFYLSSPDRWETISLGDGWYRCIVYMTATSTIGKPQIFLSPDGTTLSYNGDSSSGVLVRNIWQGQYLPTNQFYRRNTRENGQIVRADRFLNYDRPLLGSRDTSARKFTLDN